MSDKTPSTIFVIGRARSGTTLLTCILNRHPKIHIPIETHFIIHLLNKYKGGLTNNSIDEFVDDLFSEPSMHLRTIQNSVLKDKIKSAGYKSFEDLCHAVLGYDAEYHPILGNKSTLYVLFTNKLLKNFPTAKFIWIIRDYRAQINSMLKVNFEAHNVPSLAIRWKRFNETVLKAQKCNPGRIYLVRYEDLVTETEQEVKKICGFLELDVNPSMWSRKSLQNQNEIKIRFQSKLAYPINTDYIEQWKQELSEEQVSVIEKICGEAGSNFGYYTSKMKLSSLPISSWFGLVYGQAYLWYFRVLYRLPIKVRSYVMRIFYKHSKNWKQIREDLSNNCV